MISISIQFRQLVLITIKLCCIYRKERLKIESKEVATSDWERYKEMDALLGPFERAHPIGLVTYSLNSK